MIVRDGRNVLHDEGPYRGQGWLGRAAADSGTHATSEGGVAAGFVPSESIGQGLCPLCGIRMTKGNQRTCIKLPKDNSWSAMKRRGRGGYRFGRSRKVD